MKDFMEFMVIVTLVLLLFALTLTNDELQQCRAALETLPQTSGD